MFHNGILKQSTSVMSRLVSSRIAIKKIWGAILFLTHWSYATGEKSKECHYYHHVRKCYSNLPGEKTHLLP